MGIVHKNLYASGFLYHQSSQQILLQQNNSVPLTSSSWTLFGGNFLEKEDPTELFRNIIFELLGVKIKIVHTIYSYLNEDTNQYLVYSHLNKYQNFPSKNGLTFEWFTFKDVLKMKITEQTKHDIVVGQRVIDAAKRKSRGEHTFQ